MSQLASKPYSTWSTYEEMTEVLKYTPVLATLWCWWGWCSLGGAHQRWGSGSVDHTQTSWEPLRQMRLDLTDTRLHTSTRLKISVNTDLHLRITRVCCLPVLWGVSLGSTHSPCCWSCRSAPWSSACLSWRCCEDASAACSLLYWGGDKTQEDQNILKNTFWNWF